MLLRKHEFAMHLFLLFQDRSTAHHEKHLSLLPGFHPNALLNALLRETLPGITQLNFGAPSFHFIISVQKAGTITLNHDFFSSHDPDSHYQHSTVIVHS